ncbi:MAG: hypothetical protein DRI23_04865 [Candidatus Cloacimonadota bacterium]|nr:MAG: hypothetical protein DRI23_04865 [Candidatus Cloacimonadota bacterium]RLC54412.1 MAG: hypothetical protein DRH79_00570 [Candidatus Cloacimonadota bacterium]
MKKILVFISMLLCISAGLLADVNIPGGSLVDLDWTAAESPYNINGEITLDSGDELTIEDGVTVQFTGHYKFNVEGRILADGIDGNEITFTAVVPATGWHGFRFTDTDTNGQNESRFYYCNFEYGIASGLGADVRGGTFYCVNSSDIEFQNCNIENSQATTGGAMFLVNSDIIMEDTVIDGNTSTGAAGGIYFHTSDATLTDVEITNNTAAYEGGGVYMFDSDPAFDHVLVADNTSGLEGAGIYTFNGSQPQLVNLTISNNLSNWPGCGIAATYNSNIVLLNSIVWENDDNNIYVSPNSEISIDYSDIDGGEDEINAEPGATVTWGVGNIGEELTDDPQFVDASSGDYHIEATSPCLNTGSPDEQYDDPDNTRNDMGAFFFYQAGISGMVTFTDENDPSDITDVLITIDDGVNPVTTTNPNEDGTYFGDVGAGTYDVTATLDGYTSDPLSYTNVVVIANQLVTDIDFELSLPAPGYVQGTVDLNGEGTISSVVISAGDEQTNPFYIEAVPVGYWAYSLQIAPGVYDVTASLNGFQDSTYTSIPVQSSVPTEDIDFILEPLVYFGDVTGIVTITGGAGLLADVVVEANGYTTSPDPVTGEYTLSTTTGACDVTATLDGYAIARYYDVNVYANYSTTDIDLDLLEWSTVPGTSFLETVYITASQNGEFLQNDGSNQLGAFGPGGVTDCRGTAIWVDGPHPLWDATEHYFSIPGYWYMNVVSYGANPGTEQIDFSFYNSSTGTTDTAYESIIFSDNEIISSDLTFPSTTETQSFDLTQQWNWISFNLTPDPTDPTSDDTDVIFDDLVTVPDVYQVKHEGFSLMYDDIGSAWFGDYNEVDTGDGVLVQMLNAYNDFELDGEKINPIITPISLPENWTWLGYLPQTSMAIEDALESLGGSAEMIKNQTQSAVYSGSWVGDLVTMSPGVGYKINMTTAANLTYPENSSRGNNARVVEKIQPENWTLMKGTKSNMVVMATMDLAENTAVGVFDIAGNCRSIGYQEGDFWYFTVVGNEELDELYFRAHEMNTGNEFVSYESFEYIPDEVIGSVDNPIGIEFNSDTPDAPATLSLGQNHPNPFNPLTSIRYSIPEGQNVTITIYNAKGQQVCNLINEYKEAGTYNVVWNATDYSSGIYFYKLEAGSASQIKKCLLIK